MMTLFAGGTECWYKVQVQLQLVRYLVLGLELELR